MDAIISLAMAQVLTLTVSLKYRQICSNDGLEIARIQHLLDTVFEHTCIENDSTIYTIPEHEALFLVDCLKQAESVMLTFGKNKFPVAELIHDVQGQLGIPEGQF